MTRLWTYRGRVWILGAAPFITVRLLPGPSGTIWTACCGGRPVEHIAPGISASDVMRRAWNYYDARIDLVSTERVELQLKRRKVHV